MSPNQISQELVNELLSFVLQTVKALVDIPDEVRVAPVIGEQTLVVDLWSAKSDIGKVIGKDGRNIRSLRTLFNALAARHRVRAIIEFHEEP